MIGWHCDRDGCDTWVRYPGEFARQWLVVGSDERIIAHLCTLDCLMHWAAKLSEPTVRVDP